MLPAQEGYMKLANFLILLSLANFPVSTRAQDNKKGGEVTVDVIAVKPVKGKTYAVIVGIDRYQSPKIHPLNFAVADAKAFEKFLISNAGGQVPQENIRHFYNDSATTGRFKNNGLRWVNSVATEGDRVYLYFSGHGITVSGGNSYLLAHNLASDFSVEMIDEAGTQSLFALKTNTIGPLTDKGVQVILTIDACRSHLADSLRSKTVTTFNPSFTTAEMNMGDMMFISSSNGETSGETNKNGLNHGIFTYFLLKGLYGMADKENSSGLITYTKLKNYVFRNVTEFTNETQTPIIEYKPKGGLDRNPIIAKVDKLLLAKEEMDFTTSQKQNLLAVNRAKGLLYSKYLAFDSTGLYTKFLSTLSNGILWGDSGALNLFTRIEKTSKDSGLLRDAVLNLSSVLADSGQAIINTYLAADSRLFKNRDTDFEYLFANGGVIYDTLYRLNKKYFPADKVNNEYLKQYLFMKGRSLVNSPSKTERDKAREILNQAINVDSNDVYILHAINLLEVNSQNKELLENALENEKKVIKKYPNWPFAYNTMGTLLQNLKKYEEAVKYFRKAIDLDSSYYAPWINIGSYYISKLRDYQTAEKYYKKGLSLNSSSALLFVNLGFVYLRTSKDIDAEMSFKKAIQIDSNCIHAWNILGTTYEEQKKYAEADMCFKKAIQIDSNYIYAWDNLGTLYKEQNRYADAEKYYRRALQIDSNYIPAWNNLGILFKEQTSYAEAEKHFKKAVTIYANYIEAWENLGVLYKQQKNYSEAETSYTKALNSDTNNVYSWNNLITLFKEQKNDKEAERYYRKAETIFKNALNTSSGNFTSYYNLACLYSVWEHHDKALQYLELALKKGFSDFKHIESDSAMNRLRYSTEFKDLIMKYRNNISYK